MWVYLLVLLLPLALSFQRPRTGRRLVGLAVFYVFLWAFTGLRFEIGPDWTGYTYIFQGAQAADWSAIGSDREPGFFLVNKVADVFGWGLPGVNAICASLFLLGLYRFAAITANPWLATAAVLPFLVFIVSMSGVRQAAAIGLAFLALSRWQESGLLWKLGLIGLAASFHNSAVVFLIFVLWDGGRYPLIRAIVGSAVLVVAARYLDSSGATDTYASRYFEKNVESGGAFYHVALGAIPGALYLFFRKQIAAHGWANGLMQRASLIAVALLPLVFLSSTGASRLSLYFSFVQMWVFPAFVAAHGKRWIPATFICALYILLVFVVYFTLGSHVFAYVPYRNILLEGW